MMPSPTASLFTAPKIVALVIAIALNAYVVLAGADFGGGVWDLLATGARKERQREVIAHAIGPVWEANHVWLILAVVLLFTCFPPAFATLFTLLHVPLAAMLVGIVLRGSAFTFRTYRADPDERQERWGRVFAIASVVTPVLLGVCIGAVASGAVGGVRRGGFVSVYIVPWLSPFTVALGVFTLALFAFLAAVYLTLESDDHAVCDDFRRRALWAAGAVFLAAFAALLLARTGAPALGRTLTEGPLALGLHVATGLSAVAAIVALWRRWFRWARVAAAAQVSFILWGWLAAQYPYLVPPRWTIASAAGPASTMHLIPWVLAAGALVLLPSLGYLLYLFKGPRHDEAFERMRQADPSR